MWVSRYCRAAGSRVLPLTALAVVTLSCVGGTTVTSTHTMGSMTGRLVGGLSPGGDDVDCLWLEDPAGRRTSIFWPDRWDEAFDPPRLLDAQGHVVARQGDVLTVIGPIDFVGDSICSPGRIFVAERVDVVPMSHTGRPNVKR